jgi:tetratricopeptide (TPR) repeat protein
MTTGRAQLRLAAAVAAALFLLPGTGATAGPPRGLKGWIRLETANFTLFSGAPLKRTIEIATSLESFRDVLIRFHGGFSFRSHRPTLIYIFPNSAAFRPYVRSLKSASIQINGYFLPTPDANFVSLNAGAPGGGLETVFHEYMHFFVAQNMPGAPAWFNEGVSQCYATFRLDGLHGELGRPDQGYAQVLGGRLPLTFQEMFNPDRTHKTANEAERDLEFHAESWALVHYLLWGNPERRPQLAAFLDALQREVPMEEAFLGAFHTDYKTIEDELRRYLVRDKYPYLKLTFPGLNAVAPRTTPMSRDEVLVRLGELLAQGFPDRLESTEEHFREALRLNPASAGAHAGLGFLRYTRSRSAQAVAHYTLAYGLAPDDSSVCHYYGASLLDRLYWKNPEEQWGEQEVSGLLTRARELVAKAIRLDPDYQAAYLTLGQSYLAGTDDAAGIAALETVLRLRPYDVNAALSLVFLYARSGRKDDARAVADRVLGFSPALAQLGRTILSLPDPGAEDAPRPGCRADRQLALYEAALATATDEKVRAELKESVDWIRANQEAQKPIRAYDRAVGMINAGDAAGAAALLEPIVRDTKDPTLAADARAALAGLKKRL